MAQPLFAAIEGGGTKFICAVGRPGETVASTEITTRDPAATLADVRAFFEAAQNTHGGVAAFGLASFGPIEVKPSSARYGTITTTPKQGWRDFDILAALRAILPCPAAIDTDVNAAAIAEASLGAATGCDPVAYVTVGTGIGVGVIAGGRPVHGLGHPEGGHIPIRRHPDHGAFAGICPAHGDCLEGLASGPALGACWGWPSTSLPPEHPAWGIEADYLGQLCATLVFTLATERIVMGGGVMSQPLLLPLIRKRTRYWLGGYIAALEDDPDGLDRLIVPPGCIQPSGLAGAFLLAARATD